MEELKPILIKPMVVEYYNMLITDEQRQDFFKELVMCGLAGKEPTTEDPLLKMALKTCLDSIRECRENYNRRQAKNAEYGILGKEYGIQGKEYGIQGKEYGIQGKEYGIQGKEYGKMGGRPKKGESIEDYTIRKKGEDSQWTVMFNEVKRDKELIRQIKNGSMPKEIFNELSEKYNKETVIDVLRWIKEKYTI